MNFLQSLWNRVLGEPAVVVGVVVAAVNAVTVQSWAAYGAAVVTALLRFVVSPVLGNSKP